MGKIFVHFKGLQYRKAKRGDGKTVVPESRINIRTIGTRRRIPFLVTTFLESTNRVDHLAQQSHACHLV